MVCIEAEARSMHKVLHNGTLSDRESNLHSTHGTGFAEPKKRVPCHYLVSRNRKGYLKGHALQTSSNLHTVVPGHNIYFEINIQRNIKF